ncbi:MAG: hypothetical protein BGO11_19470 [Solirubrobacterales bacterium 70-9]|nr:MAG: hypothetical protein BGO11_19470 [Solirubrobacterales bacterium 70-9]
MKSDDDAAPSERLADEIQRSIVLGEYPVGSWLRHGTLAEEYGISRTPVREALRILQARGAVEIQRNRGARVRGQSPRDMRELVDLRAELEGYAAALAADNARDDQLDRLQASERDYARAIEAFAKKPRGAAREKAGARWSKANQEFHEVIQEASGNRQLRAAIRDVYRRLPPNIGYAAFSNDSRVLLRSIEEHTEVADAIRNREPEVARNAMRGHISRAGERSVRWFEDQIQLD